MSSTSSSQLVTHTFHIPSLDCPEEYILIGKGLAGVSGIHGTSPDYFGRSLRVEFDPSTVDILAIERQLRDIGFPARQPNAGQEAERAGAGGLGIRWTTAAAGLLLVLAAGMYFGSLGGTWLAAILVTATLLAGWHVVQAAWRALRLRSIDMNVLMTLAAVGAIATGDFFEAATAMFLFAVSLWLESYTLNRARRAVRSLVQLQPATAHRLCRGGHQHGDESSAGSPQASDQDHDHPHPGIPNEPFSGCNHHHHDHIVEIDPSEIQVGDLLLVRPGERIPVDGLVEKGTAFVNEAPITGESVPVEKQPGDSLYAGSLNGEGSLEMRARTTSDESTLAHVARLVEQAQAARSPTERFVDRFARRYTPAVVVVAVLLAFAPLLLGRLGVSWMAEIPATEWLHRGLVLLVIACPCAFVISTPVTILCGLHQATRLGMLIKGGEFLESVGRVQCVAFDKTGTLTEGRLQVVEVIAGPANSPSDVLRIAAALEMNSDHPLAAAIVRAAQEKGEPLVRAPTVSAVRGAGMEGEVDGVSCFAGSLAFALRRAQVDALPAELLPGPSGTTLVVVGRGRQILGAIYLADRPRSDARQALAELHQLGLRKLVMLTGDRQPTAERIGQALGVDEIHSQLLPEDKVEVVKRLVAEYGEVAMVGDGVNDAPALAAARLGIAFGTQASDTALETADIVSLSPHLRRVPELIRVGRRTRELLSQNIAFALTIKLGVLLMALAGLGTLWAAVVADVGASMVVVFNGMRVLRPVPMSGESQDPIVGSVAGG